MDTCVKCLTGLNIPVTGNGMLKKKLDEEEEAAYDEGFQDESYYDVDILYDDALVADFCIDYEMSEDDQDE